MLAGRRSAVQLCRALQLPACSPPHRPLLHRTQQAQPPACSTLPLTRGPYARGLEPACSSSMRAGRPYDCCLDFGVGGT